MSTMSGDCKTGVTWPYGEPTAAQRESLRWGEAFFKGERINFYFDDGFTDIIFTQQIASALPQDGTGVIADFCCGNSRLAQTVSSQLERSGKDSVLPLCIDYYGASLQATKRNSPDVQPVQANMLHLPLAPNTLHAGLFRIGLPFIHKDRQFDVLKQIHDVMADGAVLVVLNDGLYKENEKATEAYNTLFAAGAASGGYAPYEVIRNNRYFLSCERLTNLAEKAGFKVKSAVDLTDSVIGYIAPEIYDKIYDLSPDQRRKLDAVYEACKDSGELPFEPNSLRVRRPMYTCVLEK